jgi:hypothetical protein
MLRELDVDDENDDEFIMPFFIGNKENTHFK